MRNVFVERYQLNNWETGAGPMRADSVFGGGCLRWDSYLHLVSRVVRWRPSSPAASAPPAECDGCVCGSHPAASFHRHAHHPRRLSANVYWLLVFFAYSWTEMRGVDALRERGDWRERERDRERQEREREGGGGRVTGSKGRSRAPLSWRVGGGLQLKTFGGPSGRLVWTICCFGRAASSSSVSLSHTWTTTLGVDSVPAWSSYFSPERRECNEVTEKVIANFKIDQTDNSLRSLDRRWYLRASSRA